MFDSDYYYYFFFFLINIIKLYLPNFPIYIYALPYFLFPTIKTERSFQNFYQTRMISVKLRSHCHYIIFIHKKFGLLGSSSIFLFYFWWTVVLPFSLAITLLLIKCFIAVEFLFLFLFSFFYLQTEI